MKKTIKFKNIYKYFPLTVATANEQRRMYDAELFMTINLN